MVIVVIVTIVPAVASPPPPPTPRAPHASSQVLGDMPTSEAEARAWAEEKANEMMGQLYGHDPHANPSAPSPTSPMPMDAIDMEHGRDAGRGPRGGGGAVPRRGGVAHGDYETELSVGMAQEAERQRLRENRGRLTMEELTIMSQCVQTDDDELIGPGELMYTFRRFKRDRALAHVAAKARELIGKVHLFLEYRGLTPHQWVRGLINDAAASFSASELRDQAKAKGASGDDPLGLSAGRRGPR